MCIWLNKRLHAFTSLYVTKVTHAFYAPFQPDICPLFTNIFKLVHSVHRAICLHKNKPRLFEFCCLRELCYTILMF